MRKFSLQTWVSGAVTLFALSAHAQTITDISNHPLEAEIRHAIERGIVRGYGDGTFQPNARLTRLEAALLLVGLVRQTSSSLTIPTVASQAPFPDVPSNHWALPSLEFVKTHSLMAPYADGLFRPETSISKGYFSAALYATIKLVRNANGQPMLESLLRATQAFGDLTGHWAQPYATNLSGFCGAAFAETPPQFEPDKDVTRAYAAVAVVRAFDCQMASSNAGM